MSNWLPMTDEERRMIDDLDSMDRPISGGEADFLETLLNKQESKSASLSDKQREWLHDLAAKYLD